MISSLYKPKIYGNGSEGEMWNDEGEGMSTYFRFGKLGMAGAEVQWNVSAISIFAELFTKFNPLRTTKYSF